jgi:hypothetical protein
LSCGRLHRLIDQCLESRNPAELDDLKNKDYSKVSDPSMLRFLIDLRGEEVHTHRGSHPEPDPHGEQSSTARSVPSVH